MDSFNVTILGCGSALPTERHYCSSQIVNHYGDLFMIDCGEGTQYQFQRNHFAPSRLNNVFISHLHADHCLGLTGMLSFFDLKKRTRGIHVYAPGEFEEMLYKQMAFFAPRAQFKVFFHPLEDNECGTVFCNGRMSVTVFPLDHKMPCFGFLFQTATHSYAYCSDTKAIEPPTEALQGVDLLYHEATYADAEAPLAEAMYHSTARQAAQFAAKCQAKKLIIGHYSSRYKDETHLLLQAQEVFPNTLLAMENMTVNIDTRPY